MADTRLLALTKTGYPITLWQSSNDSEAAPARAAASARVLFVGGVHGDEPEGVELACALKAWLLGRTPGFSWSLIPCLNPEGYFSQPRRRTNALSVDLNRNFSSKDWTSNARKPRYYPGPAPGSENETRALENWIRVWQPHVIFHFHSFDNPCVVYTGITGKPLAELMASSCGYPAREDIGYPTPGSLGQFGGLDLKIPVICIEEREGTSLSQVWPKFAPAFAELNAHPELYLNELLRYHKQSIGGGRD